MSEPEQAAIDISQRRAHQASARFFLRIGQVGRATEDWNESRYLFPLPLIMRADGLLSKEAGYLGFGELDEIHAV